MSQQSLLTHLNLSLHHKYFILISIYDCTVNNNQHLLLDQQGQRDQLPLEQRSLDGKLQDDM
jgi:hypothetical protein